MRYADITNSLLEARRNPDKNPKTSALDELKKYAGRKDVFVSYTNDVGELSHTKGSKGDRARDSGVRGNNNQRGSKIGINPSSTYDTPTGIYTYPVDYVLDKNGLVPFAENAPYIQVLQAQGNFLYLEQVTQKEVDELELRSRMGVHEALVDSPGGEFWNILYRWADSIRSDTLPPEPLEPSLVDYMDEYDSEEEAEAAYNDDYWTYQGEVQEYNNAKTKEGVLGRIMASILRKLGYDGVVDYDWNKKSGQGIIHHNEPSQAFFLSMKPLTLLETIHNVERRGSHKTKMEVWTSEPDRFVRALRMGKVTDEEFFDFVATGHRRFIDFGISWDDLTPSMKREISQNPTKYVESNTIMTMAPFDAKTQIELIQKEPLVAQRLSHLYPEVYEWLSDNPRIVLKTYTPLTRFSDKQVSKLLGMESGLIYQVGGNPATLNPRLHKIIMDKDFQFYATRFLETPEFPKLDHSIIKYAIRKYKKLYGLSYKGFVGRMLGRYDDDIIKYAISLLPKNEKESLFKYDPSFSKFIETKPDVPAQ